MPDNSREIQPSKPAVAGNKPWVPVQQDPRIWLSIRVLLVGYRVGVLGLAVDNQAKAQRVWSSKWVQDRGRGVQMMKLNEVLVKYAEVYKVRIQSRYTVNTKWIY